MRIRHLLRSQIAVQTTRNAHGSSRIGRPAPHDYFTRSTPGASTLHSGGFVIPMMMGVSTGVLAAIAWKFIAPMMTTHTTAELEEKVKESLSHR